MSLKTQAIFFPFDLFGNPGTKAGTELLADAFEEMLADNKREKVPTRARAYASKVRFQELLFVDLEDYQNWRTRAGQAIREVFSRDDFLLWVSGNHLGALPLYDHIAEHDPETLILHFDAHLDLYNLRDCTEELSHGNFLLHVSGPTPNLIHVGHRDLFLKQEYLSKHLRGAIPSTDIILRPTEVLTRLREISNEEKRIVIDLDCDVFDPAFFPGVAQPQPMGISPQFFLQCLDAVGFEKLAALSISEFDPAHDRRDQSLATLMWILEYVLLGKYEKT